MTAGAGMPPQGLRLITDATPPPDFSDEGDSGVRQSGDILPTDDHATLAKELAKDLQGAVYADERFYRYDGSTGRWRTVTDREIGRILLSYSRRPYFDPSGKVKELKVDNHDLRGVTEATQSLLDSPGFFDDAPMGLAFSNGMVRVTAAGVAVFPAHPENRVRHAHPFPYDPNAPRPELDEFFDQLFSQETEEERAQRVMLLQEFAGACAFGLAPSYERCLILFGKGGQGKSQVLDIIRSVLPSPESVASLPPHMWGEQFAIEQLVGKLANIVDEIPETEIVAGATFKGVITGEPLAAERKYHPKFFFRSQAGHVFSCNQLPTTADLSEAFFDRVVLLPLSKKMRGAPGSRPKAAQHVITSCPAGIAAWAVEGAARLVRQGRYTIPAGSAQLMANWRRECDSVAIFIGEKTAPADPMKSITMGNGTRASALYQAYRSWTGDNGFRAVSIKTFASRLEAIGIDRTPQRDADYWPLVYRGTVMDD